MERSLPATWLLLGALSICDAGRADDAPFQTGLRVRMTAADGEPANDIPVTLARGGTPSSRCAPISTSRTGRSSTGCQEPAVQSMTTGHSEGIWRSV